MQIKSDHFLTALSMGTVLPQCRTQRKFSNSSQLEKKEEEEEKKLIHPCERNNDKKKKKNVSGGVTAPGKAWELKNVQ